MRKWSRRTPASFRWSAALLLVSFAVPLLAPPLTQAQPATVVPVVQAMSTRTKLVLLAGAAALYWLYKRHQNAQGEGVNGRYYRSKNGRIYYRDPKTHQAIWVTPPPASQPLAVPGDEYQRVMGQLPPGVTPDSGSDMVITQPPGPPGPSPR